MLVDGCIIVDKEITLKQLELRDLDILLKLVLKNKDFLVPWFSWAEDITEEKEREFIKTSYENNKNKDGCDLGIYYNGGLVGVFALMKWEEKITLNAEIAYWLSQEFNGKGIMTRVCKKMEEYCFTKLNFDTIYIVALQENKASRVIPEKLGFDIVDADMNPTIINSKKSYYIYYSKSQSEYKSNFWNYLLLMFRNSEIIIDTKKNNFNEYLNIFCPVDFGHLKNDWDEEDQIDIFIGSNSKNENGIASIICTMNFKDKFSDIKILFGCTPEETNQIFSLLSEKEGVLLVENPEYDD